MRNFGLTLILLFSIAIVFSCNGRRVVVKDGITFQFDNQMNDHHCDKASSSLISVINNLNKWPEIQSIRTIRIDSLPFSYMLSIPFEDFMTQLTVDRMQGLAALVSKLHLDNAPINIALTDGDFTTKKTIPFDQNATRTFGVRIEGSGASVESNFTCPECPLSGLNIVLAEKIPSLFQNADPVEIKLSKENSLEVDIYINTDASDMNRIKAEFSKVDPLYFLAALGRGNIHMRIRDHKNGSVRMVISI
jgi:hypothetical protein